MASQPLLRPKTPFHVGFLIGVMVMLVALIPSSMVVPAFGGFGHPATLLALLLFALWVLSRLHHRLLLPGAQPMRWLVWLCLAAAAGTYAAGLWQGMSPAQEELANAILLGSLGFFGVVLATTDAIRGKERLEGLICVALLGATIIALLGLVRAVTATDVTAYLEIPGMVHLQESEAAAITPEMGVVLALMLPFAIHMGRFALTRPQRQWWAAAGTLIAVGVALAPSRATLLAAGVALAALAPAWSWRTRFNLLAPMALGAVGLLYVMPELPAEVAQMFSRPGNDVVALAAGRWVVPAEVWPAGHWMVGASALGLLHVGAFVMAALALRRSVMLADRHLCACLMAAQLVAIALGFTFAPLDLSTYTVFMAIVTGGAAVMWRLTAPRVRRVIRGAKAFRVI